MVRNIVPPVFNSTGKNFSTGIRRALNFNSKRPRTPSGTKAFFNFCPLPERGGLGVTTGGRAWCGGESINQLLRSHEFTSSQVSFPARVCKGCCGPMNRAVERVVFRVAMLQFPTSLPAMARHIGTDLTRFLSSKVARILLPEQHHAR